MFQGRIASLPAAMVARFAPPRPAYLARFTPFTFRCLVRIAPLPGAFRPICLSLVCLDREGCGWSRNPVKAGQRVSRLIIDALDDRTRPEGRSTSAGTTTPRSLPTSLAPGSIVRHLDAHHRARPPPGRTASLRCSTEASVTKRRALEVFDGLGDPRAITAAWKRESVHRWPHGSLGFQIPARSAAACAAFPWPRQPAPAAHAAVCGVFPHP